MTAAYVKALYESQAEADWPSLSIIIVDPDTSLVKALGKFSDE